MFPLMTSAADKLCRSPLGKPGKQGELFSGIQISKWETLIGNLLLAAHDA